MDDRTLNLIEPERPPGGAEGGRPLVGLLDRITFQNPDSGFTIGRLLAEGTRHPITIKGLLFNVSEGRTLKLWGSWEEHREYGAQFKVERYQEVEPTTLEGMERFLSSTVAGVGERTARRIVKAFGLETFATLDKTPERLLEVPKITRRVVENVKESWAAHRAVREIMVFLHGLGISQGYAERIFRQYGMASIAVLKDNPYRLAMDVRGIGFRIADSIAAKLKIAPESPQRVEAGIVYVLEELAGEGHTGHPETRLIGRCADILAQPVTLVSQGLSSLVAQGLVRRSGGAAAGEAAEGAEPFYLRPKYDHAEARIAERLARILESEPAREIADVAGRLAALERESGIYLDAEQREAVAQALRHKVLILTGGPGTGKTTIIRFILRLAGGGEAAVALAAPTGKAAKRMAEATGHPASTIHRLLEAGREGFARGEHLPIEADLLILDESSMIDTLLMRSLLEAVPPEARLVLVGDVDQLPSVGPGMVLEDLIASGRIPVVRLERVHRQSRQSRITANAHRIRRGEPPDLARPEGDALTDFYFMPESEPERIVPLLLDFVTKHIPRRFELDPKADIQVLTPMHKGPTGAQNLNRTLQGALNPDGQEIRYGDRQFRVGDRVMQIRNDYDKDVFNGDVGEITAWDAEEEALTVRFDERAVEYARKELDQLVLAYAITVHKAQGSEYPAVVLPFTTHHAIMLQRNLLYTAITRGRRLVVVIGTENAIGMAVRNSRREPRFTALRGRVAAALAETDTSRRVAARGT